MMEQSIANEWKLKENENLNRNLKKDILEKENLGKHLLEVEKSKTFNFNLDDNDNV